MMEHPHLHCIMPSGGLSSDKEHWIHPNKKNKFFIHVKVLSRKFRGKFLDMLKQSYDKGELEFRGKQTPNGGKGKFSALISQIYKKEWVVNIQAPFGNPEKILEYLSRYVFRIAITDRRIIEIKNGKVHFSWKDYRTNRFRRMELTINEFIRRFLLHVLPKGFFKVRYYGIFSCRFRKLNIETAKRILNQEIENQKEEDIEDGIQTWEKQDTVWGEILKTIKNYKKPNCPACKKGRLHFAGIVYDDPYQPG